MAASNGYIVFSLHGHEMLRDIVHYSMHMILHRWMHVIGKDLLSQIVGPLDERGLFDLVSIGAKDNSKSISTLRTLILNFCSIDVVPVVILILCHTHRICELFSCISQLSIQRGCICRGFSNMMPITRDKNSLFNIQILPMNSAE